MVIHIHTLIHAFWQINAINLPTRMFLENPKNVYKKKIMHRYSWQKKMDLPFIDITISIIKDMFSYINPFY